MAVQANRVLINLVSAQQSVTRLGQLLLISSSELFNPRLVLAVMIFGHLLQICLPWVIQSAE